jgi:hypothetical protein
MKTNKAILKIKHRLFYILSFLYLILFFGCEFPDTGVYNEIDLLQFDLGSTLFRGTVNGVSFTGIKESSTLMRVNMLNIGGGIAVVNHTLTVLFGSGMFDNAITRTNTLHPNVSQSELYGVRPNAIFRFRVNSVIRY